MEIFIVILISIFIIKKILPFLPSFNKILLNNNNIHNNLKYIYIIMRYNNNYNKNSQMQNNPNNP